MNWQTPGNVRHEPCVTHSRSFLVRPVRLLEIPVSLAMVYGSVQVAFGRCINFIKYARTVVGKINHMILNLIFHQLKGGHVHSAPEFILILYICADSVVTVEVLTHGNAPVDSQMIKTLRLVHTVGLFKICGPALFAKALVTLT